jgi:hypothetical protein
MVMAMPDASSIAPVPGSQLSRWPPITITPAFGSLPAMSPETVQAVVSTTYDASDRCTVTGPRDAMCSIRSASGTPSAAAGTILTPGPGKLMAPVCGLRLVEVEMERTR